MDCLCTCHTHIASNAGCYHCQGYNETGFYHQARMMMAIGVLWKGGHLTEEELADAQVNAGYAKYLDRLTFEEDAAVHRFAELVGSFAPFKAPD